MLGRGKESAPVLAGNALISEYGQNLTEQGKLEVPDLPSAIVPIFEKALQSFDEHKLLTQNRRDIKLPSGQREAYDNRIWQLETILVGAHKVLEAHKRGYDPHTIPPHWYAGTVTERDGLVRNYDIIQVFRAPMPPEVLEKYDQAKKTKLFKHFLVASPDPQLFRRVSPMFVEPVLVGFIPTDIGMQISQPRHDEQDANWNYNKVADAGVNVRNATSFLIAHWDLQKDLKFNP